MIDQYENRFDLKNVLHLRYSFRIIWSHIYLPKHFHVRKSENGQLAKSSNEYEMIIINKKNKKR